MRAQFHVFGKVARGGSVFLTPVVTLGKPEKFWRDVPQGETITLSNLRPDVYEAFEIGKNYNVIFEPAE
jgi:hypothetical protein